MSNPIVVVCVFNNMSLSLLFQRKAKFLDYERAAFKPLEPSTRSSIYWTGNTGRKDIHVLPYSYIDLKPKEPPKDYDFANPIYRPFVDLNREWDQSVIPVNENTFYIPYKLKNRSDAKHSSVTSTSDTDTESDLDDGWPVRSITNFKPDLPRYTIE